MRGGFEAGLVGGIADWFAVTALFRHPLGIPIPHTSLLLKNKSRIVQSLVSAVENELLNKQSIEQKLGQVKLLQLATTALTKLFSTKRARLSLLRSLVGVIRETDLDKLIPHIQSGLSTAMSKWDMQPTADVLLTKALTHRLDEKALDLALDKAGEWCKRPQTATMLGKFAAEKLASAQLKGVMGFAVQAFSGFMGEDKLGAMLQHMLLGGLRDMRDTDNVYRQSIVQELRVLLFSYVNDDNKLMGLNIKLTNYLTSNNGADLLRSGAERLRAAMLIKLEDEMQTGGKGLFKLYRTVIRAVSANESNLAQWEKNVQSLIVSLIESNHYRIGQLVKENIDRMDDASLVQMLESKIGKDLQWIRVNGAVCGFMIGIVLALFQLS